MSKNFSNKYIVEDFTVDTLHESFGTYGNEELNALTYSIIGAAIEVYNSLGKGFLEAVYKDCLCIEFNVRRINFEKEKKFEIIYKGIKLPRYYNADFLVENKIVLEIKAQNNVIEENVKQVINYLAVTGCKVGLLINFGESSLKYKRIILTK